MGYFSDSAATHTSFPTGIKEGPFFALERQCWGGTITHGVNINPPDTTNLEYVYYLNGANHPHITPTIRLSSWRTHPQGKHGWGQRWTFCKDMHTHTHFYLIIGSVHWLCHVIYMLRSHMCLFNSSAVTLENKLGVFNKTHLIIFVGL